MTEQNRPPQNPQRGPGNQNNQQRRHPPRNNRGGNNQGGGGGPRHDNRRPQQNRPHHNNQQGTRNKNNSGTNNIDQMLMHYDRLVEQHIEARRKFFEFYYRVDYNRRDKLEDQFYFTAQNLIRFQRELLPWQYKELQKNRTEIYSKDDIYSTAHPEGENLPMQPAVNETQFHLSPKQLARESYKQDNEMSVGTLEDYLAYKASIG